MRKSRVPSPRLRRGFGGRAESRVPKGWLRVFAGVVLSLAAFGEAAGQGGTEIAATPHYRVVGTAAPADAKALADFMELVYKTYCALLSYDKPINRPFTIQLYATREEFLRVSQTDKALAFYSPQSKNLVGYQTEGVHSIFAHEGMHQFTDMVMPAFNPQRIPMWYSEGIADCIGNCEVRKGKLYMCTMTAFIARMRILVIQEAVRQKKHLPLDRLTALSQQEFMGSNARLHYAQSWSFCHFLMTGPKVEDDGKQIPAGKYKKHLVAYHNLLADGTAPQKAFAQAFAGLKVEKLEEEWAEYVMKFPDPLAGTGLEGLRPDLPSLDKTDGVYVGGTLDGSPAASSGLRAGDCIVAVNGRKVEHFGILSAAALAAKPGEALAVDVRRGGSSVTLQVSGKQ